MPEGTLFIYVFLGLAPGIALLLAWRSVRRALREPRLKWTILVVGTAALGLWTWPLIWWDSSPLGLHGV